MGTNYDILCQIVEENVELRIANSFEDFDTKALRDLIRFIKSLYHKLPPERIDSPLTILTGPVIPKKLQKENALTNRDGPLERLIKSPAIIYCQGDGGFLLWNEDSLEGQDLAIPELLAYQLSDVEAFWANGKETKVTNANTDGRSAFAIPTFWSLEEALSSYYLSKVCRSHDCELKDCWLSSECLRWKSAPEHKLRDSLYEYLNVSLRAISEIKREQNADATHPVDIKVTWIYSRARALIEIKWLGKSFDGNGHQTCEYSEGRAKEGATQLRDYINSSEAENHELHFVGYLIVFDGRRRRVTDAHSPITVENALYYKDHEFEFDPEVANDKRLNLGYRFFIEPHIA